MPQGPGTYGSKVGRPAKKKTGSALGQLFSPSITRAMGGKTAKKAAKKMAKKDQRKTALVNKLRKKLGSQFTEKEAERMFQAAESRRRMRRAR